MLGKIHPTKMCRINTIINNSLCNKEIKPQFYNFLTKKMRPNPHTEANVASLENATLKKKMSIYTNSPRELKKKEETQPNSGL